MEILQYRSAKTLKNKQTNKKHLHNIIQVVEWGFHASGLFWAILWRHGLRWGQFDGRDTALGFFVMIEPFLSSSGNVVWHNFLLERLFASGSVGATGEPSLEKRFGEWYVPKSSIHMNERNKSFTGDHGIKMRWPVLYGSTVSGFIVVADRYV